MTDLWRRLLGATGLVRGGRLGEATAQIQRALADAMPPAPDPRTRPPAGPDDAGTPAGTARSDRGAGAWRDAAADVVDVEARDVSPQVGELRAGDRPADAVPAAPREESFAGAMFSSPHGNRAYKLYLPPAPAGTSLPLVVMLHGCTQNPDDFATGTRMNAVAREHGVAVLYPEQAQRSNANRCWNWFVPGDQHADRGEPAILAAMARRLADEHGFDARRVFVAGLSAGGAMAAILARECAGVFAAAGVHSGLPAGSARDVGSAFAAMKGGGRGADASGGAPVIVFHGDADATVAVVNGRRVVEAVLGPAAYEATQDEGVAGRPWTRTVYRSAGASPGQPSRAEAWIVRGAGHAWSGGDAHGSFADAQGPDASREMLRFFLEHAKA